MNLRLSLTCALAAGVIALAIMLPGCKKNSTEETKQAPVPVTPVYTEKDIYYYSYTSIEGQPVSLSAYQGKKILFVNTASYCSNTPQYDKLEALYKKYGSRMVIIGFPCNQFGSQEPGDNSTIKDFCTGTYHVTFPISQKIDVKDAKQDAIYKWLTKKAMNGKLDSEVEWNFQKYLVAEDGSFISMFANDMQPDDPAITSAIEK